MNQNSLDRFHVEFRRDTVVKFIKDLIDGRIRIPRPKISTGAGKTITDGLVDLTDNIEKYVSNESTTAEERNKIEFDIFSQIVLLATSDRIIREKNTSVYDEIQRLDEKMDSTNDLLKAILIELTKQPDKS